MEHLAKLTVGPFENRPVHIECSCGGFSGPAGDFVTEEQARLWMVNNHFAKLTGVSEKHILSLLPNQDVVPEEAPFPDFVDEFHKAVQEIISAPPTPSAPAPASPPEPGEEVA